MEVCGSLITETGDPIVTESGNRLVTECFTSLRPGRVIKGKYPYWQPRRKPFWEDEFDEDEGLLSIAAIEMD